MNTPRLLLATALALTLAACSEEQTAKLQAGASAAIGVAGKVVNSSEPLGELANSASAAAGVAAGLGQNASAAIGVGKRVVEAAAVLNPELAQQVEETKQQVDAVKQAADILQGK